jgi:hypothetical protein
MAVLPPVSPGELGINPGHKTDRPAEITVSSIIYSGNHDTNYMLYTN